MIATEIEVGWTYAGCTLPDRTVLELRPADTADGQVRVIYFEGLDKRRRRSCPMPIFLSWVERELTKWEPSDEGDA